MTGPCSGNMTTRLMVASERQTMSGPGEGKLEGRVVRSYSNVYYVDIGGQVLECRPRGRLKLRDERVLAGDLVRVSPAGPGLGAVDAILPRRNSLSRPAVANVDQVVLVFAIHEPDLDLLLLDRFLVRLGLEGLPAALCLNKSDLATHDESEAVAEVYRPLVTRVTTLSAHTGVGLEDLRQVLAGQVSVLAGPSGAGKSSLLNALDPSLDLRTGLVSRKVRRGTHTTRHVELIPTGQGGLVADTPGFTHLELENIKPSDLGWYYPEIADLAPTCRFSGCLHRAEPDCQVKQAVAEGRLDAGRYRRYLTLLVEVEASYRPW